MGATGEKRNVRRQRSTVEGVILAVLCVALLVFAGVVWRHHANRGDRLEVGDDRGPDYAISTNAAEDTYDFRVPGADLTVRAVVGHEGSKSDVDRYNPTIIKAPQDGLLVGVTWSATTTDRVPTKYLGKHKIGLSVRSRASSIEIDRGVVPERANTPGVDDEKKIVAVPGGVDDVELVVTFEGRTQSLDIADGHLTAGDFATLYATDVDPARGSVSSERTQPPADEVSYLPCGRTFAGQFYRTPYVDGAGWAARGHQWILIEGAGYRLNPPAHWKRGDEAASYVPADPATLKVTADGNGPIKLLDSVTEKEPRTTTNDYLFSAGRAGAAVNVEVVLDVGLKKAEWSPSAPARLKETVRRHTRYPAVVDPPSDIAR